MICPKCDFDNTSDSSFCSKCGTQLPATKPSRESDSRTETFPIPIKEITRGSSIAGRYEVIEELGSGGMGRVYKVYDKKVKEIIALKLIKPEIAIKEKTTERFSNELRLARKISHRNVCRMFDLSEEEGISYITMEYVSGEDLKSMIRMMGQLSAGQAVFLGKQICEGLTEAHRLGVVHRDLKPKNIMLDKEGNAKIMDFGIACSLDVGGITESEVMIGTAEYMSPEQVEGKEVDHRSDIYSFGITLYEMVTGKVPFEGDRALAVALKQKTEIPRDPMELNTQIPEALSLLILKCMEKDKEKRYQDADEVLLELSKIEEAIPSKERTLPRRKPTTSKEITVKLSVRKIFIPVFSVIALVVLAILIWNPFGREEIAFLPQGKHQLAILYFGNNTGDESLDHWRRAISDLLITDFTQSKYFSVLSPDSLFYILDKLDLLEAKSYSSEDLKKVADRCRATHVLWGNYNKAGDAIRVIYTLQEAKNGELINSEWVEGAGEERMFSLVDELTRMIKVNFQLTEAEIVADTDEALEKITQSSPKAYKYFQLGRHLVRRYAAYNKEEDFQNGVKMYEKAIQIDPRYALAYCGLGDTYETRLVRTRNSEDRDVMHKNFELAYKINPNLAETNAGMGWSFFYRKDLDQAYQFFKKSLALGPNSASINFNAGSFLRSIGLFHQAIIYYSRAIEQDFLSMVSHRNRSNCLMYIGQFKEAALRIKEALDIEPDNIRLHLNYARQLIMMKKLDEAEKVLSTTEEIEPGNSSIQSYRAWILAAKGEKEKALELIEGIPPHFYLVTMIYSALGMKDVAIENIEKGINIGFQETSDYLYSYPILVGFPYYDNLRGDHRFEEIVKREKKKYEEKLKKYGNL